MSRYVYTAEQRQKIQTIISSNKGKAWNTIADTVNSQKIVPKNFTGRSLFKTSWAWKKSTNPKIKATLKAAKDSVKGKKTIPTLKTADAPRIKRAYKKRAPIHKLEVPETSGTNNQDSVIVMVIKSSNIRSVLEQLQ